MVEIDQASCGMTESTLAVEWRQVRLKIDVEPLDAPFVGIQSGAPDQLTANASTSIAGVYGGIQDKRVDPTVPGQADKPDQTPAVSGGHSEQAVRQFGRPVRLSRIAGPGSRKQDIQVLMGEW